MVKRKFDESWVERFEEKDENTHTASAEGGEDCESPMVIDKVAAPEILVIETLWDLLAAAGYECW